MKKNEFYTIIVAHNVFGPSKMRVLPHIEVDPIILIRLVLKSTVKLREGKVTWPNKEVRSKTLDKLKNDLLKQLKTQQIVIFNTFLQGTPCHMQLVEYIQLAGQKAPRYKMLVQHPYDCLAQS